VCDQASDGVSRRLVATSWSSAGDVDPSRPGAASPGAPIPGKPAHLRRFERLIAEAADRGVAVALEPTATSRLASLAAAVDFVRSINNPSAGLCLDLWHLRRVATTNEELAAALPIDRVLVVELADGADDVVGSLAEDNVERRLAPGLGALDAAGFAATMHELGWRGPWGVEIMSRVHRRLPVDVALRDARSATLRCLDEADARLALPTMS